MVEPVIITITADLVGLKKIDLPQFAGYDIMVNRRSVGDLDGDEVITLPGGGFELKQADDEFVLNEKFTVIPLPKPIAPPFSIPVYPTTQYPHVMTCTIVQASVQDGNGNWQPGSTTSVQKACRAEPNNKDAQVKADDGTQIVFDYTVYMPLPVDTIKVGTRVVVYSGEEALCNNTVKRFSRGQLNARLWL